MEQVMWTVEVPDAGCSPLGLEEYEVRSADGEHVGIVASVVDHEGVPFVVVDAGLMPPLVHSWRAIRWQDVAEVDHDALVVTLLVDATGLEQAAFALNGKMVIHGPGAEATRRIDPPGGLPDPIVAGSGGPLAGPAWLLAAVAGGLTSLSLLVIVVLWATRGLRGADYAAFAIPAVLAALAIALTGYTLYREPHTGHHRSPE